MQRLLEIGSNTGYRQDSDVIICSSVSISRNLDDTPYPWRSSLPELSSARTRMVQALLELKADLLFENLEDLPPQEGRLAGDRGFIPLESTLNCVGSLGLSPSCTHSALINALDHLKLTEHSHGFTPQLILPRLMEMDTRLEETLRWAFVPSEGYLCARSDDNGTGLCFTAQAFLPSICAAGIWDRVARGLIVSGMKVSRIEAEEVDNSTKKDGPESSRVILEYRALPGQSETESLNAFISSIQILCQSERKARERMREDRDMSLSDETWRALALLKSARLVSAQEARILLSRLRYGCLLGLLAIKDTEHCIALCDELTIKCGTNYIQVYKQYNSEQFEDILEVQLRADILRSAIGECV